MLDRITPLVLTFNEDVNIRRLLQSLVWAKRVVVVDSESTDRTSEIVGEFPNAQFLVRAFDELARQWNYGLQEAGIESEWVLALDADYVLLPQFLDEIQRLNPPEDVDGYRASFRYCVDGVPLRCGLYPPVTVLFRRARAVFRQDGHAHRVSVPGRVELLDTTLLHDDRKPLSRWFSSQVRYLWLEAEKLTSTSVQQLPLVDRIRRLVVVAPVMVFFYCLIVRGGVLDGPRGIFYAMQRAVAEVILGAYLVEAALRRQSNGS